LKFKETTMSILDRLSRLLRANINDLINRAEDPQKIIEQALSDMRDAYQQARTEVAGAMGENIKLEREVKENQLLALEYKGKAEDALKANRDDLAREALKRKKNFDDLAVGFAAQLEKQSATIEGLKTQLRALEAKIDEFEGRKKLLQARQTVAQASETLDKVSGFDKARGAAEAFERMDKKVTGMEDTATAREQLNREQDLDGQLADLGRDKEVDDELAEMKKQLGQS
jgi:phage shock protein A